ncbi:MAG: DUF3488 and transglutaminase-like domain-containing protein, partial [Longimicrobiales bacterium]|nr:DUF3488 and transglutaminase-like domain-containing protein [Longimicrobiales bacterium]
GWGGRGDLTATSIAGFGDQVSIGDVGARIQSNPSVVLRVEFPEGLPAGFLGLHWRGRSYDHFDGVRWTRSDDVRPSRVPPEWFRTGWPGEDFPQRIFAAPLDVRVLFGAEAVTGFRADAGIFPMQDNVGDWSYWGSAPPVYTAYSRRRPPAAEALRTAERGFMPDRARYLQLPRLPDRIAALADSVVAAADAGTRYDRAVAVERFFRTTFGYTRELPRTAREATLDHFLFARREGHCEYFSTAMVVMLRSLGIHARNVTGFLGGRWNEFGGYLAVTQNEAHSWVEVWFPGYGWVPFDPTPGGSAGGEAATVWNWPGRLWLDGVQHRWNKWILDYSLTTQVDLAGRLAGGVRDLLARPTSDGAPTPPPWALALGGAVLIVALLQRRSRGRAPSPDRLTRGYLSLVRRARGAGHAPQGPVAPMAFLGSVARACPEAAAPAGRVVELYTRARFGGASLTTTERRDFRRSVREARRRIS